MTSGAIGLSTIWRDVEHIARESGAVRVGACRLDDPFVRHFEDWLEDGLEAGMTYLRRNLAIRKDPFSRFPLGRSAIVVLVPYSPDRPIEMPDSIAAHVARYAQGDDYHDVVDEMLRRMESAIAASVPDAWTWRYVDTGPLSDRALAVQAGLGWIGRNGMLIEPELGSWHFIGVLLTSLEHDMDSAEITDRCGECTACITTCPTDAIRRDRLVDSSRCLSYLTIEHRGPFPPESGEYDFAGNVFGCDICQEVCPWNADPPPGHAAFETRARYRDTPVHDLVRMSQEDFSAFFRKSAVKRAKRAGMIRNTVRAIRSTTELPLESLSGESDDGIRAAVRARRSEHRD
jgi:epoxyqueuosine reductase